jgi:hypothetical protein
MGMRDGSIITAIITVHMPRKTAAALSHVWPGISIHTIDIVQPPGIGIVCIDAIDIYITPVTAALTANVSAQTPKKTLSDVR